MQISISVKPQRRIQDGNLEFKTYDVMAYVTFLFYQYITNGQPLYYVALSYTVNQKDLF